MDDSPGAGAESPPTLDTLPTELLHQVWLLHDNPANFALTCKRFRALSKDVLWRAKWFMQYYVIYEVIFYAIARPRIFDASLFDQLVRLGAPVSRNLVQMLNVMHDQVGVKVNLVGGSINSAAYEAVMRCGKLLYGNQIRLRHFGDLDGCVFTSWLSHYWEMTEPPQGLQSEVRVLFNSFNFMPLPLSLTQDGAAHGTLAVSGFSDDATAAIMFDPQLAATMIAKGYELTAGFARMIINGWFVGEEFDLIYEMPAVKCVKELKVDGIVHFPKDLAQRVFEEMHETQRRDAQFVKAFEDEEIAVLKERIRIAERLILASYAWQELLDLDAESALPYELLEVIDATHANEELSDSE